MSRLPLYGVRVLDITAVIGAPYGTALLADMGAEVIRVESTRVFPSTTRGNLARPPKAIVPSMGPVGRGYPAFDPGARPWNRFALFNCHANNKLSMTVDLRQAEGVALFHRLVQLSDMLVENVTGVMEKLGLGYAELRKVRPDIIMVSLSGMGATGPYKDNRGFGGHFEDVLGHGWLRGEPEEHPRNNTTAVASDPAAGAALVSAAMAALHYRRRTGKGQHIDMSMGETYIHHLGQAFLDYSMNGRVQRTLGNRHQYFAPHGCYPCRGEDRWVTIAVRDNAEWEALCRVLGEPEWARDPRFADGYGRRRHQDEIDPHISAWTRQRGHIEAQETLQRAGVPAGAILDAADVFVDPHLRARGFYRRITHAEAGTHEYPFAWWQMSRTPMEPRRAAPLLGEHNRYVYGEILGTMPDEYARLEAAGHIGVEYNPSIK